jgi:diaminohydroxyphosphoribosylaminopyrimidine deaminase / 5-amino-6-(5-phosphoribosylamino)uracil reductase
VLVDDPSLTARDAHGVLCRSQPLRVVMGLRDLSPGARVLDASAPTVHLRTRDPAHVLAVLHARDVQHVYLEGGPTLAGAFVRAGLVDRVVGYYAGRLLGSGSPALGAAGVATLADAPHLTISDVATFGPDVRVIAHPCPMEEE